uniref:Uncharacterized protein n=1 Tax=Arundo donax TaxID=35708 RepID=A0A0A9UU25_ARUDO
MPYLRIENGGSNQHSLSLGLSNWHIQDGAKHTPKKCRPRFSWR